VTVPHVVELEEGTVRIWHESDLRADHPEIGRGELLFEFGDPGRRRAFRPRSIVVMRRDGR
jgi:hypothetical protein